ncbi:hypothetical protein D3C78_1235250 [compost metagenome]
MLLELGEAEVDRIVRRQRRIRAQGGKAFGYRCQHAQAHHAERPLLGADLLRFGVGPHQIEGAGAPAGLAQCRPGRRRVFHRQPGARTRRVEQGASRQFGGKAVVGHRLQMILRFHSLEQFG